MCAVVLGVRCLAMRLRYRISGRGLEITLFGVCLRRIKAKNIKRIVRVREGWCEPWPNTLTPGRRIIFVERIRGWPRFVLVTPQLPFAFKGELERAISGQPETPADPVPPADSTTTTAFHGTPGAAGAQKMRGT